jgi:hypothetical protein
MGMFSEIHAESHAKEYEDILLKGIENYERNNGDVISTNIVYFLKQHVYPKYDNALGEAWRTTVPDNQKKIDEFYEEFSL